MPTTQENLETAFAGESKAAMTYLAYAKQAEKEGYTKIAAMFRAIAEAEMIHAQGHLSSMGKVKSTVENLKTAAAAEMYEMTTLYPPMLEQAEKEGHQSRVMFRYAISAEAAHAEANKTALAKARDNSDLTDATIQLCHVCGHLQLGRQLDECPLCARKGISVVPLNRG